MKKITCLKCMHFFITWERSLPYGCKAWGVRAHQYPDTLVHGASGMNCQLFELKPAKVSPAT